MIPARKLPRATKRAARTAVRHKLPRHRRMMVHPISVMILLCAGVLIAGMTYKTLAASVRQSVRASAPPLTEGAVINDPVDGQTFTTSPITVHGNCPDNSYVKLYRNSTFSGSAWCSSGSFDIATALSPGTNTLQTRPYNVTDSPGPVTDPINIIYTPPDPPTNPVQPVSGSGSTSAAVTSGGSSQTIPAGPAQTAAPPLLSSDYTFHTFLTAKKFIWSLEVKGGVLPYAVSVDWRDGATTAMNVKTGRKFTIEHTYLRAGYFPVRVDVTDALGARTMIQLAALIDSPGMTGFAGSAGGPPRLPPIHGIEGQVRHWLWLAAPTYAVVGLMTFSFWLGERQQVLRLARIRYAKRPAALR